MVNETTLVIINETELDMLDLIEIVKQNINRGISTVDYIYTPEQNVMCYAESEDKTMTLNFFNPDKTEV